MSFFFRMYVFLKKEYHSKWNEWFLYAPKSTTDQGNIKSPGYIQVIEWLNELWTKFEKNSIVDSFQRCGITSQNHLHTALAQMLSTNNPFPDYIDDYDESDDTENFINDEFLGCDEETVKSKEQTATNESIEINENIQYNSENDSDFYPKSSSEDDSDTDQQEILLIMKRVKEMDQTRSRV